MEINNKKGEIMADNNKSGKNDPQTIEVVCRYCLGNHENKDCPVKKGV